MKIELPQIVIVGGGGHAKVCIDVIRSEGRFKPVACVDGYTRETAVLDVPIVGGDDLLPEIMANGCSHAFVAIGSNRVRDRVSAQLLAMGFQLPAAVHPQAVISTTATIGQGVLIMPGVVINAQARIDDMSIINTNAVVEHDCVIGRAAHLAPGTILAGNVQVGARAFLGAGSVARPGVRIAEDATAGSGAVMVSDVAASLTVVGVPARPLRASQ